MVLLLFSKLHLWRTKPFSSNMNPAVCVSTGGGERDKAASVVYRWTWSHSTLAAFQTSYRLSPRSSSRPLSFPLSSFSSVSLSALFFIGPSLPPAPVSCFHALLLSFHSSSLIFCAILSLPSCRFFSLSFLYLFIFSHCLSSHLALYYLSLPTVNRHR